MTVTQFNPKVSIVIPVYNGANYISSAIDSALNQTYKNIEVIVVNDGSNDEGKTEKIAKSYGNKIRYFLKENGGVSTAFNLGIKKMTGEYFSWLSHDDLYYPNKIEAQIDYLKEYGDKNIALYSDYDIIDEKSNFIYRMINDHIDHEYLKHVIINCPIHGSTVLIHNSIFKKVGLFNEDLRVIQDFDMWQRIAEQYAFIHLKDVLVKVRFHKEQGVRSFNSKEITEVNNFFIRCLKTTSIEDMKIAYDNKSASAVYAMTAIKHKRRRVSEISIITSRLAKQYLVEDNLKTMIKNLTLIFYCDICNLAFKSLKKFQFSKTGPNKLYKIKGFLQRLVKLSNP